MKRYTRSIIGFLGILSIACMMLSTFISPASIGQMLGIQALRNQGQVAHAAAACVSPPSGFDPTTATAAQLAEYNLPPAPSDTTSTAYTQWKTMVQGAKTQTCHSVQGTEAPTNPTAAGTNTTTGPLSYRTNQHSGSAIQSTSTTTGSSKLETKLSFGYTDLHSGYAVRGDRDGQTINEMYSEWNIPCSNSTSTNGSVVSLLELGVAHSNTQVFIGVRDDDSTVNAQPRQITWGLNDNDANYLTDYSLGCSDHMRADITSDGSSTVSLFIEDTTQGIYFRQGSTSISLGKGTYAFYGEMRFYHKIGNTYTLPPLYNFGSVNWTSVQAASTSSSGTVMPLAPIEDRGDTVAYYMGTVDHSLAQPSGFASTLPGHGSSFTNTFYNAS
jgi:hypothetical protein